MKNIFKILMVGFSCIVLSSCGSQTNIAPKNLDSLLQKREFTFMAERADPTNFDVINVLNSLPNTSYSQILNLDPGYNLVLKKGEIIAQLPYFGRMYNPSFDQEKNSLRFTTKDFSVDESVGKKESVIYTISPKDSQNIQKLILQVYKNGKAYLSINANDRQSISFDGYIIENSMSKEQVKN